LIFAKCCKIGVGLNANVGTVSFRRNQMKTLMSCVIVIALIAAAPAAWANKASATSALGEARAMVRTAERSGADALATTELKMARELLNSAQVSFDDRDWDDAEYAAKKSFRDSELAEAKTEALKAEAAQAELQAVVDTLRSELKRMGAQQ
jgi:hypothetical protein